MLSVDKEENMPDMTLTDAQAQALRELLDRVLGDMSVQIADTDLKSFRDDLKEQRDHLKSVRDQLGS